LNTRFVLIDFENIQPKDVALLKGEYLKIKVFVGSHQTKIPLELAHSLQPFGTEVEYIKIDGDGKNALDFHVAYYIGRLSAETPGATFQLVSKDCGFDPLIRHLKSKGLKCSRTASLTAVSPKKASLQKLTNGNVDTVIDNLKKRQSSKPSTLAKLKSTILTLFKNQLSQEGLDGLIRELKVRGVIEVSDGKVQYLLP